MVEIGIQLVILKEESQKTKLCKWSRREYASMGWMFQLLQTRCIRYLIRLFWDKQEKTWKEWKWVMLRMETTQMELEGLGSYLLLPRQFRHQLRTPSLQQSQLRLWNLKRMCLTPKSWESLTTIESLERNSHRLMCQLRQTILLEWMSSESTQKGETLMEETLLQVQTAMAEEIAVMMSSIMTMKMICSDIKWSLNIQLNVNLKKIYLLSLQGELGEITFTNLLSRERKNTLIIWVGCKSKKDKTEFIWKVTWFMKTMKRRRKRKMTMSMWKRENKIIPSPVHVTQVAILLGFQIRN